MLSRKQTSQENNKFFYRFNTTLKRQPVVKSTAASNNLAAKSKSECETPYMNLLQKEKKNVFQKLALKLTCIMQPKYCKFSPTAKNCLTTYTQLVGNVRSNTRDICFFSRYLGQIKLAWN